MKAIRSQVQTRTQGCLGAVESLVVIRTVETQPRTWYTLTAAGPEVPLPEIVRAHAERHRIEEGLQEAKGEVGLGHYEVRSWTGWHHHMTLCLLALLFVVLEKLQLGKKTPAITAAQVRAIFTELLRHPRPTYRHIAEVVSKVLRRSEEARIYAWHTKTGTFPPRRQTGTG